MGSLPAVADGQARLMFGAGDMGQHAFAGGGSRLAPAPQIENESRIARDETAEARGRECVGAQMALHDR
jgi:hypothetical protein